MLHAVVTRVQDGAELDEARRLFREYAGKVDAPACFEDFERELDGLPGPYAPPEGALLLATEGGAAVGCIALGPLDGGSCEIKRLYVDERHRGTGLGRRLVETALAEAKRLGYRRVELETVPAVMPTAHQLYERLGFRRANGEAPASRPGVARLALELA